jgi:Family of unknown function (DUF6055)
VLIVLLIVLFPRVKPRADGSQGAAGNRPAVPATEERKIPPTSEALIAAALAAGDLTYEESLLQRAYAIYGDPRVEPAFRSPVIDWEAGDRLFHEVAKKEQTLSAGLLEALLPFRVRPNHPASIFSRPRDVLRAQQQTTLADWVDFLVPGTEVRLWIQGHDRGPLEQKYGPMVSKIWRVFPQFFPHPFGDAEESNRNLNPGMETDVYLVHGNTVDPRAAKCRPDPGSPGPLPIDCTLARQGNSGSAPEAAPKRANRSAGYVLADVDQDADVLLATIAHELAHVTQHNYDVDEGVIGGIGEATATWVEYKVVKALGMTPGLPYGYLDPSANTSEAMFDQLHVTLTSPRSAYASWLFYYYASMELGNDVVTRIWQSAGPIGFDGIKAVNSVVPLEEHFPKFAVRNWNHDVPRQYVDDDSTFPSRLRPNPITLMPSGPATTELNEPVASLAAQYYHYSSFDESVRRVTFENLSLGLPHAHVWALKKIGNDWKPPEDWTNQEQQILCRDIPSDDVTELVLIVSNSDMSNELPPHPRPRVLTEDVGCETIEGTGQSTLRLNDPEHNVDVTYVASLTTLQFRPRTVQDEAGNTQYDLLPASVVWSVAGRDGDCKVNGRLLVRIPSYVDQDLDPTRPAWGYMKVVGRGGGDFHSIWINAYNLDDPAEIRTCPGNPPRITRGAFRSAYLLHILMQANTHDGNAVSFKGRQTLDPERFQDNLVPPALEALKSFPGASQMLNRRGGKMVYTFEWELRPRRRSGP